MSVKALSRIVPGILLMASAVACAKQAPTETKPAPAPARGPAAAAAVAPGQAAPDGISVSGRILETMDAGGYTYMRLATTSGETWAAVNQASVKKGDEVRIAGGMTMTGFESKTLKRTFESIIFGRLDGGPGSLAGAASSKAAMPPMASGHASAAAPDAKAALAAPHASASNAPVEVGEIKVKRAEGSDGKTIAEIYARKASLKGTKVSVRGKVVKLNSGIMGRNWIHLRDGSGTREGKDDDLTVTSTETVAVGDVVLVKGTVQLDRDFGAGYTYPVIVEEATFSK